MRQIIDQWELLCKECFAAWFIMNNFPEGLDVSSDCSLAEIMAEGCVIDKSWVDELTGYYEGVFDENDGYIENPKTVELGLSAGTFLYIEFHPGDTLYFLGTDRIGCTGSDYSIRKIEFSQFVEYTKEMDVREKIFLLPMLKIRRDEKEPAAELIMSVLRTCTLHNCDLNQICACILENCIDSTGSCDTDIQWKYQYFSNVKRNAAFTEKPCQFCGKKEACLEGVYFGGNSPEAVCLSCLADKKAEVDVPEYIQNRIMNNRTAKTDELRYTPPVPWVQYNDWPVCCDDYMQYVGEWQQKDFIAHSLDGNGVELLEQLLEQDTRKRVDDIQVLWEDVGNDTVAYIFKCHICGKIVAVCQSY